MGELELAGTDALGALQELLTNDAAKLAIGQAQYSALTTPTGTVIDDVIVHRVAEEHYMLVVNAANTAKDHAWIKARLAERGGDAALVNASARYALIAVQGPEAANVVQALTSVELDAIRYYWFATGEVASVRATISRTGTPAKTASRSSCRRRRPRAFWDALLDAGRDIDICPCGLRDTLRLEAGMRLCGNDMDEHTSVVEAGLGWIVAWKKPSFTGAEVLRAQKAGALTRRLVAFAMADRAIARHGHVVMRGDEPCGVVTSGTQTPFLKRAIGPAMVPLDLTAVGSLLDIDIRGRRCPATVVPEPFYRRSRKAVGA